MMVLVEGKESVIVGYIGRHRLWAVEIFSFKTDQNTDMIANEKVCQKLAGNRKQMMEKSPLYNGVRVCHCLITRQLK